MGCEGPIGRIPIWPQTARRVKALRCSWLTQSSRIAIKAERPCRQRSALPWPILQPTEWRLFELVNRCIVFPRIALRGTVAGPCGPNCCGKNHRRPGKTRISWGKPERFSIADQSRGWESKPLAKPPVTAVDGAGDLGQHGWHVTNAASAMERRLSSWPPFPWKLPLAAVAAWLILRLVPVPWWPSGLAPWLATLDDLLSTYAGLQILGWLLTELPSAIGLWREPPTILRDLSLLLIGTAFTVVIVQQQVRINLVSLVTASAVLTAVIGLAAQETLKDLFAGITMQLDPPFRIGDWIALGETRGTVSSLTLMNTVLWTADGSQVVLPNSLVGAEQLKRFRPEDPLGVQITIGLDYGFAPAQALQLLRRVVQRNGRVLRDPAPNIWIDSYGESAIHYTVLAYQAGSSAYGMRDLRSALLQDIWYALRRHGQSIPYPVRDLLTSRRHPDPAQPLVDLPLQRRCDWLAQNAIFSGMSPVQVEQLAASSRVLAFAPAEAVVVEGDQDDDLYQLISGSLQVSRKQAGSDEEMLVTVLHPGDIFGEMSLLLDAPRSATVRALEEVVLLQVSRTHLAPLMADDPLLLEQLAAVVSQRRLQLDRLEAESVKDVDVDILSRMRHLFGSLLHAS